MEQKLQAIQRSDSTIAPEAARLVSSIINAVVDHPANVTVSVSASTNESLVMVFLEKGDYSRVLEQQGRIVKSLRTIVNGLARRAGESITVEVVAN